MSFFLSVTSAFTQTPVIDSLQRIVDRHLRDTTEVNALLNLTFEYTRKDSEKAMSYCYQIIALAKSLQMPSGYGGAYGYLVTLHQNSGQLDSAGLYLALLEKASKENPTKIKLATNYFQNAGIFYKNQGQYKRALPFMLQALALIKSESENYAGQLLNVGNTYQIMGDFKQAVNYHLQALSLFEKVNSKRGQSFCLQSLGNDLSKLGQFAQAQEYYQRSVKLKEELKDKRGIINGWSGLGDVYKEQKQYQLSEKFYKQCIQASQEMKLILEEARSTNQLGLLYGRMGDAAGARTTLSKALVLARQGSDDTMAATINSELMALAVQEKQEKSLESELFTNLNTFVRSGDRSGEALEYYRLSEYYALNNQFSKAFGYLKKHSQLKDSLEGSAVVLQIKKLEEQYESDKKEKEIALLRKDQELQSLALNQQRAINSLIIVALISVIVIGFLSVNRYRVINRNKRMLEVEKMRNNIARDLHDDIGSTLSSINIISQLALKEKENAPQHLSRIAENSARIMENMSDIVWSIHPGNDTLEQVLIKMKEFTAEILESRNISYQFKQGEGIAGVKLDVVTRKNVFLIVKEAINNAAKYSLATEVFVNLQVDAKRFHLTVSDNGKGFDLTTILAGNGLKNMKERAESIQGAFHLTSMVGRGTEIKLEVPIT